MIINLVLEGQFLYISRGVRLTKIVGGPLYSLLILRLTTQIIMNSKMNFISNLMTLSTNMTCIMEKFRI